MDKIGLFYKNGIVLDKIACFDLDYTLITTKSGNIFPTSFNDWKPLYDNISQKLNEYIKKGYHIVIFTNQKKLTKETIIDFSKKIENIMLYYDIPINNYSYYISYTNNGYRKPMTGMYDELNKFINLNGLSIKDGFYCGDAGGRVYLLNKKEKEKRDFSITDYYFAKNTRLEYKYPEEIFNQKMDKFYIDDPYNKFIEKIWNYKQERFPLSTFEEFNNSNEKKMIIMVGCPASGKTRIANIILNKYKNKNYTYLNKDLNKNKFDKLLASCQDNMIIDNTNPSLEIRQKYYNQCENYKKLIFYFDYPKELCKHLNNYRTQKKVINDKIPDLVYNIYFKKLDIPSITETNNLTIITIKPEMIIPLIKSKEFYYYYDI